MERNHIDPGLAEDKPSGRIRVGERRKQGLRARPWVIAGTPLRIARFHRKRGEIVMR